MSLHPLSAADAAQRNEFLKIHLLAAGIITSIFLIRYGYQLFTNAPDTYFLRDFEPFYRALINWQHGASPYCLTCDYFRPLSPGDYHPFVSPPFLLFFLWPLQFFPYEIAGSLLLILQCALWIAILLSPQARLLWPSLAQTGYRYRLTIIVFSLPFLLVNMIYGQLAIFYASALLLGCTWLQRKPITAGIAFGLLACKPQLALMVPVLLLAGGHWRATAACALTVIALVAVSIAYWGIDIHKEWAAMLQLHQTMFLSGSFQEAVNAQMLSIYSSGKNFGLTTANAFALQVLIFVIAAFFLIRAVRQRPTAPTSFALFFIAALMATPYLFQYDTVILNVVLLILLDQAWRHSSGLAMQLLLMLFACYPILLMLKLETLIFLPLGSLMLIVLGAICVRRAEIDRGNDPTCDKKTALAE